MAPPQKGLITSVAMRERQSPTRLGLPLIAVGLFFLVVYIGTYLSLLSTHSTFRSRERHSDYQLRGVAAHVADWVFWPLESMDRKLRPDFWHDDE